MNDGPGSHGGRGRHGGRDPNPGPAPYDEPDPYDDPDSSHYEQPEDEERRSRRRRNAGRSRRSRGSRTPRTDDRRPADASGPADPPGRRPRRPGSFPPVAYFAAAGVIVLVAVVVAAAALVFTGGDDEHGSASAPQVKNVRAEGPGASAYSQAASTAAFAAIADRSKDRKPLTTKEAFATKKITDDDAKASLKLTASSLDSQCLAAIWGSRLAGRLQQGQCTQVARASYEDKNFDALVTIFNLATDRAADQVVADADPKAANGFPLVPPKATPFDQGFSIARGVAMGHYAVITWVRHADGSGDERDPALLSLLVTTGRPNAVLVRATGPEQHP